MGAVRRTLECTACGLNYRTVYRGRHPLCRTCLTARVSERQTPQCMTSLSQLPDDVLQSMASHLLRCIPHGPFEWAAPQYWPHLPGFLRVSRPSVRRGINHHDILSYVPGSQPPRRWPIINIWIFACLPILRIKLVCKSLQNAVDAYLSSLLRPALECQAAAARIQKELATKFFPRVRLKREDEYADARCWSPPPPPGC